MAQQIATLKDFVTRDQWLLGRRTGIGASEVAILFGLAPASWGSTYSLWAEKTGRLPPKDMDHEWLKWGLKLEPVIAAEYEERTERKLWTDERPYAVAFDQETEHLRCTPDRWIVDAPRMPGNGLLQIKNTSFYSGHDWQAAGVPDHIQVQVQSELACTGLQWGSVAVLRNGNQFFHRDMMRDDHMIQEIREQVEFFWGFVERDEPPPIDGSEATSRAIKALHPDDDGSEVPLPPDAGLWVQQWEEAKAAIAATKKIEEARSSAAENQLREAIGSATYGVLPDGRRLSLKTTARAGYEVAETKYRQLRIEKEKKGKNR